MRAIFRDPKLQDLFEYQGYVQVDLLSVAAVRELENLFDRNAAEHPQLPASFTAASPVAEYRHRISTGVRAVLRPSVDELLDACCLVVGHFFHKQASSADSQFGLHQDWTFVDERRHHSLSIWCPLDEVDEANGTLVLIPGSHRLSERARGFGSGFPFPELQPILRTKYSRPLTMRPGQAVLFHQRLFHWSGPNRGPARRLAVNCSVAPEEAQLVFPHADPKAHPDRIELLAADESLHASFQLGVRPEGARSLGFVDARMEPLDDATLERVLGPHCADQQQA